MNILDIEKLRYTIRSYSDHLIETDKLEKILEAGRWAPTAVNYQPQRIIVLNTDDNLRKLKEFTTCTFDGYYANTAEESAHENEGNSFYYYNARTALLVCYDKEICWNHPQSGITSGEMDATIVSTHMMLEATSIGVGSSWISYFDSGKAKTLLGLPERFVPVVLLLLGYPSQNSQPNEKLSGKRYKLSHTVFYNAYNDPIREEG